MNWIHQCKKTQGGFAVSCSVTQSCPTFRDLKNCGTPSFHVLHHLLKVTQIHVHWVSDAIQPTHPLSFALLLPSIFPSVRVFSNESALCIKTPKYWNFLISPSNEYSRLISFRMDWLDLLAVQGTLKSLLQHHSSKASILLRPAFIMVQLSHPYMTTEKTIALNRWIFVSKVMSLLFNMLTRLLIAFLPRSKRLLISWLQSPSVVILEPKNIVCHCFHHFPIYLPWSDGTRCHDFSFKPAFSLSSFTFIKRLFNFSSFSTIRVVSSAYLRLLIFLLAILSPDCASSNLTFYLMHFA